MINIVKTEKVKVAAAALMKNGDVCIGINIPNFMKFTPMSRVVITIHEICHYICGHLAPEYNEMEQIVKDAIEIEADSLTSIVVGFDNIWKAKIETAKIFNHHFDLNISSGYKKLLSSNINRFSEKDIKDASLLLPEIKQFCEVT